MMAEMLNSCRIGQASCILSAVKKPKPFTVARVKAGEG